MLKRILSAALAVLTALVCVTVTLADPKHKNENGNGNGNGNKTPAYSRVPEIALRSSEHFSREQLSACDEEEAEPGSEAVMSYSGFSDVAERLRLMSPPPGTEVIPGPADPDDPSHDSRYFNGFMKLRVTVPDEQEKLLLRAQSAEEAKLSYVFADYDKLYAKFRAALLAHASQIRFTAEDFIVTDLNEVNTVFSEISMRAYDDPELFFFYGIDVDESIIKYNRLLPLVGWEAIYCPSYTMTKSEADEALGFCRNAVKLLTSNITPEMSDFEKALLIHDTMALNFHYDGTYTKYDMYSLLSTGSGVCQAYAVTYKYILESVGVESEYVVSVDLCHEWNRVRIGGKWYHVDVTWDDPMAVAGSSSPDIPGKAEHLFFLVSDSELSVRYTPGGMNHYGFDTGFCNSSLYDNAFWYYTEAPIVFDDSYFYFFYKGGCELLKVAKDDIEAQSPVILDKVSSEWYMDSEGHYYDMAFSGLSLVNGLLVYNDYANIYVVTTDGSHKQMLKYISISDLDEKGAVFRLAARDENGCLFSILNARNAGYVYFRSSDANDSGRYQYTSSFVYNTDNIHRMVVVDSVKSTYVTEGYEIRRCTDCDRTEVSVFPPMCGEEEPTAQSVLELLCFFVGDGDIELEAVDANGDGKADLSDMNAIMRMIRESLEAGTLP